jgi:hypothetical protein
VSLRAFLAVSLVDVGFPSTILSTVPETFLAAVPEDLADERELGLGASRFVFAMGKYYPEREAMSSGFASPFRSIYLRSCVRAPPQPPVNRHTDLTPFRQ